MTLPSLPEPPLPKQEEPVALKPCPFCGSESVTIGYAGQPAHSLFIACTACYANGPSVPRHSDQHANLWNTRPSLDARMREALEPLADLAKHFDGNKPYTAVPYSDEYQITEMLGVVLTVGHCRKARATLSSPVQSGKMGGEG